MSLHWAHDGHWLCAVLYNNLIAGSHLRYQIGKVLRRFNFRNVDDRFSHDEYKQYN